MHDDSGDTRVLESQTRSVEGQGMIIRCRLTPESALHSLFRIETAWSLQPSTDSSAATTVIVHGEAELLKRIWGLQSYAESLLSDQASD